jgi:hypothetical protein
MQLSIFLSSKPQESSFKFPNVEFEGQEISLSFDANVTNTSFQHAITRSVLYAMN